MKVNDISSVHRHENLQNYNQIKLLLHIDIASMTFDWLKLLDNHSSLLLKCLEVSSSLRKVPVYMPQSLIKQEVLVPYSPPGLRGCQFSLIQPKSAGCRTGCIYTGSCDTSTQLPHVAPTADALFQLHTALPTSMTWIQIIAPSPTTSDVASGSAVAPVEILRLA